MAELRRQRWGVVVDSKPQMSSSEPKPRMLLYYPNKCVGAGGNLDRFSSQPVKGSPVVSEWLSAFSPSEAPGLLTLAAYGLLSKWLH